MPVLSCLCLFSWTRAWELVQGTSPGQRGDTKSGPTPITHLLSVCKMSWIIHTLCKYLPGPHLRVLTGQCWREKLEEEVGEGRGDRGQQGNSRHPRCCGHYFASIHPSAGPYPALSPSTLKPFQKWVGQVPALQSWGLEVKSCQAFRDSKSPSDHHVETVSELGRVGRRVGKRQRPSPAVRTKGFGLGAGQA